MNRLLFNAMMAQYATPEINGNGLVNWEKGVKCVIPSVRLAGAAVQDGTPTPDAPIMPVCSNGVVVSRGRNVFDAEGLAQELLALDGSSRVVVDGRDCVRFSNKSAYKYNAFIPFLLQENTQYTIKLSCKADGFPVSGNGSLTLAPLYTDGTTSKWISSLSADAAQDWYTTATVTEAGKTIRSLYFSYGSECYWYIDIGSIQMVEGAYTADTMPPYTPYYNGGQAQAPELWAIPGTDYRDEWDAQTGKGIRRIKKIVFTGQESLLSVSDTISFKITSAPSFESSSLNAVCTHLKSDTWGKLFPVRLSPDAQGCAAALSYIRFVNNVDGWDVAAARAYFAEQYAAGTPVTVWYALANPEPFYSPPARLTQPTGYGQVIQVGGDIPNCPITAKYLTHR